MPKTGTAGDAARWAQLKAAFYESCGKTWNKDCEDGKLAELYRAALGTSSPTEVQHKGGFAGNWDDDTQPDVDHWLNRMERSKRHGAAAKRMREAADLPEFSPRPKKKQATGAKPKKTSGGDLPAKLLAGWVEQKGEGGAVYYLETATNRIQFDRPTSVAAAAGLPATNGVGDSDVERLLDEFLGTAQQKMQPGGLAAGQGVPDAETQQQQQQHLKIEYGFCLYLGKYWTFVCATLFRAIELKLPETSWTYKSMTDWKIQRSQLACWR